MPGKLTRLAALGPREWLVFCQLVPFALCVGVSLRYLPLSRLIDRLTWGTDRSFLQPFPLGHRAVTVDRLVVLADFAARGTGITGRCLARSLLLFWFLKVRGEPVTLLAGVRKENATIIGHAWIEWEGQHIADDPTVTDGFVPVMHFH